MGTWMRFLGMTRDARTSARILAALFAFALIAAACGDDSDDAPAADAPAADAPAADAPVDDAPDAPADDAPDAPVDDAPDAPADDAPDAPADDAPAVEEPAAGPKYGGTLRWDVTSEVAGWFPTDVSGRNGGEDRSAFLYDYLLLDTEAGGWTANIATDMTTDDGITWTMTLRDGVMFTDGTPLDAEAVKFNVERTADPESGSAYRFLVSGIAEVSVIDPLTVEFVLKSVNGLFPIAFTRLPGQIASPTAYMADPDAFSESPVGAGPFMMDSFIRDGSTRMVRNPDYWDAPKPYLDAVEFRVLPDATARAQALLAREIDLVATASAIEAAINADGGDDLKSFTTLQTGAVAVIPNWSNPPFDDVRIREAVALSFDYEVINQGLLQGGWAAQKLACPPYGEGRVECLPGVWPEPDPARGRELVQEYLDEGNTFPSDITLLTSNIRTAEAEIIQQAMGSVGIDVTIEVLPIPEYVDKQKAHGFDLVYSGVSPFSAGPRQWFRNSHPDRRYTHNDPNPSAELAENIATAEAAFDDDARVAASKWLQQYNGDNFMTIWFAPPITGISGKSDVILGDRYAGGQIAVAQDTWLDR